MAAWNLELKILLLGVATVLALLVLRGGTLQVKAQAAVIALLYGLCFLVLPYWSAWPAGVSRLLGAGLLIAAGLVLPAVIGSYAVAWSVPVAGRAIALFAVVYLTGATMFHSALAGALTYYGDSDFHTTVTLAVVDYFTRWRVLIPTSLGLILTGVFAWRGSRLALVASIAVLAVAGALGASVHTGGPAWYLRYPALFYYVNVATSVPLYAWHDRAYAYAEGFYRLLPFLSVAAFATIAASTLPGRSWYVAFAGAIAILTLPTLAFYASVTYPEPLILVLIALALLGFEDDLPRFVCEGRIGPALGALVLIGFLKETAIVSLAVFAAFTLWTLWRDDAVPVRSKIERSVVAMVVLFAPIAAFLAFRAPLRGYAPHLSNLLAVNHYRVLTLSWWEQFGLLAPLAPVAWVVLWRRGERRWCALNALLVVGYVVFFTLDGQERHWRFTGNELLGYSRYNLYVLPSVVLICTRAASLADWRRAALALAIVVVIANVLLSPVRPGSRERGVFWGDYTSTDADVYVPYDQVYGWVRDHPAYRRVLVLGRSYEYQDWFYFMKYRIRMARFDVPRTPLDVEAALQHLDEYDVILYHDERFRPSELPLVFRNVAPLRIFATDSVRVLVYMPLLRRVQVPS